MLVGWQSCTQTCLCLVLRTAHMRIYRIRDIGDTLSHEESTLLSLLFQPSAAAYKMDVAAMIEFLLAAKAL